MFSSRDRVNAGSPHDSLHHPLPSLSVDPSLERVSARWNELDITELGRPPYTPATSPPSAFVAVAEPHHQSNLMHASCSSCIFNLHSNSPSLIGSEGVPITAGVALTVQLTMITSGSMNTTTTTRVLLFLGMIFELLAILLATTFQQFRQNSRHPQRLLALLRVASGVTIVFLLMGIVGLVAALVVEVLKISLGIAVVMSGFLVFGITLCLLTLFFGIY